ncbi:MAG: DUF507 family protein [Nitrospirota bacterium]
MDKNLIILKEDDSLLRREIKRTIINELKFGEELDGVVRQKLQSLSKKPVEGSPEWDVMYKKYFEEEEIKKGRR